MLSGLTAWQSICGVATAAEAALRIYEYGVEEDPACTLCPLIILDIDETVLTWTGGTTQGTLPVDVRIELEIPPDNRGTYSEQGTWFWQQLSALLAGITGAVGGGGQLMFRGLTMPVKPGLIDIKENNGRVEWMTTLRLDVYLK